MGEVFGKLANMQWARRMKKKQIRELRYNPHIRSVDFIKRTLLLTLLGLYLLKYLNAAKEVSLETEFRNLYLLENIGQTQTMESLKQEIT